MANETLMSMLPNPRMSIWMNTTALASVITIVGVTVLIWVVRFIRYRQSYKSLAPTLPSPPHSLLFGNLGAMGEIYAHIPINIHPHVAMTMVQRKWNLRGLYFLDTWPMSKVRQLVIIDPDLAVQVTQTNSRPKSPAIQEFIGHIVGPTSLLFTEGEQWKKIRSLFNSGFSLAHLMTLVPSIVDDTIIFCEVLGEHADSGEVRPIETAAAHLTIDIMGHIVLDIDLNSQREENELVEAFRNQISWSPSGTTLNPFQGFNLLRPFMHKYYESKMNNYLERVLDDRYATSATRDTIKSRRKPAIDLALDEYSGQQDKENFIKSTKGMDKAFKSVAIDQMKTFLFAGHDTSSSTVAYAYHLLNLHPDKMAKARAELDQVFGKNTDSFQTGKLIKQNPNLLNSLPYILSIIKETLRLYTPALTVRQGQGTIVYEGVTYDTEGFQVLVLSLGMHRNADFFPSPDEFIPERFMPAPHNFQEIPKDVYRPFEKGPRDCIGQQLAILEMKIILAMTLRDFDIKADYETWDKRLGREKPGDILDGRRGMFGDRAYQQLIASAKPHDGLPGRVTRTNRN